MGFCKAGSDRRVGGCAGPSFNGDGMDEDRGKTPTAVVRGRSGKPQVRRLRGDGWTEERKRIFFDHMAATCNVRFSAGQAGMSNCGCYIKRRNDQAFADEWQATMADGYVRMETMLIARAGGTDNAEALTERAKVEREDADGATLSEALIALTESLDSQLALQLMASHRKTVHGGVRSGGVPGGKADPDALDAAILKQLAALKTQRGEKA